MISYIGVALFGAGMAFCVVNDLGGRDAILRPLSSYDIWMICAGGIGADIALYLTSNRFGHHGRQGAFHAFMGSIALTFVATLIAGTLALPGYGTMFGLLAVAVTFWANPFLALIWATMLLACHLLFAIWRRERDSIFRMPDGGYQI